MMYRIEDENKNPAEINSNTINYFIKHFPEDIISDDISDGYHTFGELYKHRIHLFIALCRHINCIMYNLPNGYKQLLKSKKHFDGSEMEGWFIVQIESGAGQISYHLPNEYWDICEFIETVENSNKWDGHTPDDVLKRLLKL